MSAVLNAAAGAALKHRGQQLALDISGNWAECVLEEFAFWLERQRAIGLTWITVEEFRAQARNRPVSANAWGSLPRLAMKAGLIEPKWAAPGVQDRAPAASVKTHGHEVKRWNLCPIGAETQ